MAYKDVFSMKCFFQYRYDNISYCRYKSLPLNLEHALRDGGCQAADTLLHSSRIVKVFNIHYYYWL